MEVFRMKITGIICCLASLALVCGCASTKKVQELINNNNSEYVDKKIQQNNIEYVDRQIQPVITALNTQKENIQEIRTTLEGYEGIKDEIENLRHLVIQTRDEIKPLIAQLEKEVQEVQKTKDTHARRIGNAEKVLQNQKRSLLQFFNNELKELESLIGVLNEQMEGYDNSQTIEEKTGVGETVSP
jgi:arsenate reductase-like glutaredoxin family protein